MSLLSVSMNFRTIARQSVAHFKFLNNLNKCSYSSFIKLRPFLNSFSHTKSLERFKTLCSVNYYSTNEDSAVGQVPQTLSIVFTCRVCNTRQQKQFSKHSYTKGVVLIQCDGCKNRHLIADNLGWFSDTSKNVEDILREKGEEVTRGLTIDGDGITDNTEIEKTKILVSNDDESSRS